MVNGRCRILVIVNQNILDHQNGRMLHCEVQLPKDDCRDRLACDGSQTGDHRQDTGVWAYNLDMVGGRIATDRRPPGSRNGWTA